LNRDLPWGRIALALLGYIGAVLVAVSVTVFVMLAPSALPDNGAWGSYYANSRQLADIYPVCLLVTFVTALPGFLVTLFVARLSGWVRWLPYACAGALDAVIAWTIFDIAIQMPDRIALHTPLLGVPLQIFLPSLPGGFVGGLTYWAVVRKSLPSKIQWYWS